jgi:transposase InsO family protein
MILTMIASAMVGSGNKSYHLVRETCPDKLEEAGIKISMDGKGQALDNARTERFFRTIKYDLIYIEEFATPKELRK